MSELHEYRSIDADCFDGSTPLRSRRRWLLSAAALLFGGLAASAYGQFGGRSHPRGGDGSKGTARPSDDKMPRPSSAIDPAAAVERELPSLRVDLNLTTEQIPLYDSFERQLRSAAEAGRMRARHLSSIRVGEGSTATADTVLGTIADDDTQRAEASRLALERMNALYGALTAEQKKQFDRRIIQSLREPLGNS